MKEIFASFDSFTFFPAQMWSHTWERQHEISTRLAKHISRQIYVFPPLGLVDHSYLSKVFLKKILRRLRMGSDLNNAQMAPENMNFINSFHIPGMGPIASTINYWHLNRKLRLGKRNFFWATYMNPTIYKFFSHSAFKVLDLAERRQVNEQLSKETKLLEKRAVKEADLVVVDNMATLQDYRHLNENIFYIPQGVDLDLFPELKGPRDCIGYIGHLHDSIDYDYLSKLIQSNPQERFLIVGPAIDPSARLLDQFSNVERIPQVPKSELAHFLSRMKLGLIPYKINAFTEGVYPTKLFEYLAAGVPVLSTTLPEVVQFSSEPFIHIESCARTLPASWPSDGCRSFSMAHTWDSRFSSYISKIAERLI